MIRFFCQLSSRKLSAKPIEGETERHNWQEYSTHTKRRKLDHMNIHTGNFIERTRTCDVSHELKSVVYYCDVHDHTHSEIFLEDTVHSEEHE
ncbi:hypothetical protein [Lentibacillus sp. CBA3610]|uniref:hypothetical protein n=1 Tax=Lentibacillus sp. CBA3610 TaxID=2518176 RepID=UPI0015957B2F|nr:hypothetical protein [Lentibacillus sp. CBA3610]QKY70054.1 hypothetical protein Len3610_11045 [Lentibacillus sp. CBA3610]